MCVACGTTVPCLAAERVWSCCHVWPVCVCRCLEDKAREMNISDLASFYGSTTFTGAGFQLDRAQSSIAYHV